MNNDFEPATQQRFLASVDAFRHWFLTQAMPLWASQGVDLERGGFFEKLDLNGRPLDEPRRTRVVARQIYVFCVAIKLGWQGDAQPLVLHGLDFLLNRLRAPDHTFHSAVTPEGAVVNPRFDLYEQAFALFALATVHKTLPMPDPTLIAQANATLAALRQGWGHPVRGFEESRPRSLPLRANPHMHLMEAALQWAETLGASSDAWWRLADELADLALEHMVQPGSGLLTELFDGEWRPAPGQEGSLVEPGHLCEWGWLLLRWGQHRNRPDAISKARHMIMQADALGLDTKRGTLINEMGSDGQWRDANAKLWPQTERIKAWTQMALMPDASGPRSEALARATQAMEALALYLKHPRAGLWHEVMHKDGTWSDEATRASSLYHIVCALETVHDAALACESK